MRMNKSTSLVSGILPSRNNKKVDVKVDTTTFCTVSINISLYQMKCLSNEFETMFGKLDLTLLPQFFTLNIKKGKTRNI